MSEWQPIETAPYQKVIEVKNNIMDNPVLAIRGYSTAAGVHPNNTFCTSVYTPDKYFPFPPGKLVCPTQWRLPAPPEMRSPQKKEF